MQMAEKNWMRSMNTHLPNVLRRMQWTMTCWRKRWLWVLDPRLLLKTSSKFTGFMMTTLTISTMWWAGEIWLNWFVMPRRLRWAHCSQASKEDQNHVGYRSSAWTILNGRTSRTGNGWSLQGCTYSMTWLNLSWTKTVSMYIIQLSLRDFKQCFVYLAVLSDSVYLNKQTSNHVVKYFWHSLKFNALTPWSLYACVYVHTLLHHTIQDDDKSTEWGKSRYKRQGQHLV